MIPDNALIGKWSNVACARKNAVVCQKMQVWSVARLQKILMEERKLLREEISRIKQTPVPPGFIYVQLPGQSEPKLLWPSVNWTDVSESYAGLFFRVLGKNSEAFDTEQSENDRHLESVRYVHMEGGWAMQVAVPSSGEWSGNLFSGDYQSNLPASHQVHNYKLTSDEIRPRNKAVKIWKRVD